MLRIAFWMLVFPGLVIGSSVLGAARAQAAPAVFASGIAAIDAIADTLLRNGVDPFVPAGAAAGEPLAAPAVPADSESAFAQALSERLSRSEPNAAGVNVATLILPRERPSQEVLAAAPPPPKTPTITDIAQVYKRFIANLTYIAKLRLDDPRNLRRAQQLLVNHDLISLARGWMAWCSEIAAHSQDFVAGIEKAVSQEGGAATLEADIESKPSMALNFSGSQNATLAIRQEIAHDNVLMSSVAWRLTEIAYGRPGNEARLALEANQGNFTTAAPDPPAAAQPAGLSEKAKPLMVQMLALGAHLHLANKDTVGMDPAERGLAANKDNDQCLKWAQLNLDQCLAAARDNSERAYCLGTQGIGERAKCWSFMAGAQS